MKSNWREYVEKYLSREIRIEYKTCLYFSCILFYYFIYLIIDGVYLARIIYMCEMILAAYFTGYVQEYIFHNFDEADHLNRYVFGKMVLCSGFYTAVSYIFCWFGRHLAAEVIFYLYMMLVYAFVYLFHKLKRAADTKNLNKMLEEFKKGEGYGRKE